MGRNRGGGASGTDGRTRTVAAPARPVFRDINNDDAIDYLKGQYKQRVLTEDQRSAMAAYKGTGFVAINDDLRFDRPNGRVGRVSSMIIRNMDDAMRPLEEDLILHRVFKDNFGGGFRDRFYDDNLVGHTFTDAAYTSASVAKPPFGGDVVMRINTPKGTPTFMPNPSAGKNRMEKEIGIHRNAKFKVVAARMEGTQLHIEVDYEGPGPKAEWETKPPFKK